MEKSANVEGPLADWIKPLFELPPLLPESSWTGHIPFLFLLFCLHRPRTFVELGVYNGASFLAGCEAAKRFKTQTHCYGVDTWQGDGNQGYHDNSATYEALSAYIAEHYQDCSLIRSSFNEAASQFQVGAIDLLHIDGFHTYEAVSHDFRTWQPKLSQRSIVLFHDIAVRNQDFGVWKLWAELTAKYRHFEFYHSYGLGVLVTGATVSAEVDRLLSYMEADKAHGQLFRMICGTAAETLNDRFTCNASSSVAVPTPAPAGPKPIPAVSDPSLWNNVGRNKPCPCGSGKRYKHCHGRYNAIVGAPDPFWLRAEKPSARIAVVCHLSNAASVHNTLALLKNVPETFDLFISLVDSRTDTQVGTIKQVFPQARVFTFPDVGRDILPFVWFVNSKVLFNYELVCKIHDHGGVTTGEVAQLFAGVIDKSETVEEILRRFRLDRDCGIVCSGEVIKQTDVGDLCLEHTRYLANRTHTKFDSANLHFPAGTIFWIRPFILRLLADVGLSDSDFHSEADPSGKLLSDSVERLIGVFATECGMNIVDGRERLELPVDQCNTEPQIIAFYLPQYHPTPENDRWWGQGFTDWINVAKAAPLFQSHYQPRVPSELGFYDLRLEETAIQQSRLAAQYGIAAFCYYFYWFGRPVLDLPLRQRMSLDEINLPFCLCWANENWTRNWDGRKSDILIQQDYNPDSIAGFARNVLECFCHPHYLRLDGNPVLVIYNPLDIPDCRNLIRNLRDIWTRSGVANVHLVAAVVYNFSGELPMDPQELGFDAYLQFPPHHFARKSPQPGVAGLKSDFQGEIYDYEFTLQNEFESNEFLRGIKLYRGVMLGWDNTARRGNAAHIFHRFNPGKFRRWLRGVMDDGANRRLLFVNAWNEWAESSYLEPDQRYGRAYLEAVGSCVHPSRIETLEISKEVTMTPSRVNATGS